MITVLAAHSGFRDLVEYFLEKRADPNAAGAGFTALQIAIMRRDEKMVSALLANGADVDATDYRGYTPLMHAAQYDRDALDIVHMLLARGANANVTAEGQTPASIAARRGDTALACLLREATARTTGTRQ